MTTKKSSTASKKMDKEILDALKACSPDELYKAEDEETHIYGNDVICETNSKGHPTPGNRSKAELMLDASDGFIPLWGPDVTLRWRFNNRSMQYFTDIGAAKRVIRQLWGEALLAWGDVAPIQFKETNDAWDFEIVMQPADKCRGRGCVLASAFFPDAGRHQLKMYPKMFEQSRKEVVETFIHEVGHVFGLRHFFAQVRESAWPSVRFGTHSPFSIMNYGPNSRLTETDRSDLRLLYSKVWSGELRQINGTPIRQMQPYHELRRSFFPWSQAASTMTAQPVQQNCCCCGQAV